MIIIPLGFHCNISYLNKGLCIKKETGVFEWFESRSLQYITDVINTLTNNPKENVVFKNESFVYLLNINFLSGHYTNNIDQYKLTFQRRYARFINIINKEDNIYFIRIHPLGNFTTKNEIELFIESIKRINPNIRCNFLCIDTIESEIDFKPIIIDINNVNFYHKYFYEKDVNDRYMRKDTIIYEQYKKILEEIGYSINNSNCDSSE